MNDLYRDLLHNSAKRAISDARAIQGLLHSGLKGQLRELFVRELLQPMLPPEYVVGSGNIITAYNQVSAQIDVVVCDRRIVPPILFQGDVGIFPIESVLCTVEVKSKLDASELRGAQESAAAVGRFAHCVGRTERIEHVLSTVFAFDSDLSGGGKSEIERYNEISSQASPDLRGICVVGRGSWHVHEDQWFNWELPGEHGEVVGFLVSIVNRIQEVARTRSVPNLLDYINYRHAGDPDKLSLSAK